MSGYVVGSLIGGGFVLAGGAVAAVRDSFARRAERRAARAAQLQAAMREYLAVLDALAFEMSDAPANPTPTRIDRWLDRLAQRTSLDILAHILVRVLRRAAYGRRPDELVDRAALAATQLRLVAPESVLEIMRKVEAATERAGPAGADWNKEWKALRDEVRQAFRAELAAAR